MKTGPATGHPPPISSKTIDTLLGASKDDLIGQHQAGQDGGDSVEGKKVKSEKERMDPS